MWRSETHLAETRRSANVWAEESEASQLSPNCNGRPEQISMIITKKDHSSAELFGRRSGITRHTPPTLNFKCLFLFKTVLYVLRSQASWCLDHRGDDESSRSSVWGPSRDAVCSTHLCECPYLLIATFSSNLPRKVHTTCPLC